MFIIESWWDWNSASVNAINSALCVYNRIMVGLKHELTQFTESMYLGFIIESWWDWNPGAAERCCWSGTVYNRIMVGLKHPPWCILLVLCDVYNRIMVGLKRCWTIRMFSFSARFIIESWWDWNLYSAPIGGNNCCVYNRIMVGLKHKNNSLS